jgi:hypothetical protein
MPHYARGQTKRLPQRGGQNAVRPDTLIPRPRLSTKPGQAQTNVGAVRLRGVNRLHHWTVLAIFHNAPIRWPSALDRMMRSIGDLLAIRAVGPLLRQAAGRGRTGAFAKARCCARFRRACCRGSAPCRPGRSRVLCSLRDPIGITHDPCLRRSDAIEVGDAAGPTPRQRMNCTGGLFSRASGRVDPTRRRHSSAGERPVRQD